MYSTWSALLLDSYPVPMESEVHAIAISISMRAVAPDPHSLRYVHLTVVYVLHRCRALKCCVPVLTRIRTYVSVL